MIKFIKDSVDLFEYNTKENGYLKDTISLYVLSYFYCNFSIYFDNIKNMFYYLFYYTAYV